MCDSQLIITLEEMKGLGRGSGDEVHTGGAVTVKSPLRYYTIL